MYRDGILSDFCDIREKVRGGGYTNDVPPPATRKYADSHVFDEDKSVRWNREEVDRQNRKIAAAKGQYQKKTNQLLEDFRRDVIAAVVEDTGLSEAQAEVVFRKAREDGHSEGMESVIDHAIELGGFALDVVRETGFCNE